MAENLQPIRVERSLFDCLQEYSELLLATKTELAKANDIYCQENSLLLKLREAVPSASRDAFIVQTEQKVFDITMKIEELQETVTAIYHEAESERRHLATQ
jgi:hypothetical protein